MQSSNFISKLQVTAAQILTTFLPFSKSPVLPHQPHLYLNGQGCNLCLNLKNN